MISKEDLKQTQIDKIFPYPNNSRYHSEKQIQQIAKSIEKFGFNNPIQVDENAMILSGHGRLFAAQSLGLEDVPKITIKGLSDTEKQAYVIADNKLGLNSSWDDTLLEQEIEALREEGFDLDLLGWDVVPDFAGDLDYSILDDNEIDNELQEMTKNVKKAIQIEFEPDDFQEAQEVIKFWRQKDAYIGGIILDYLRKEMNKL